MSFGVIENPTDSLRWGFGLSTGNSSKCRRENISEQAYRFNTVFMTHFLFALSVQPLNALTANPTGRLLLMFSFGCFAKNINIHLSGGRAGNKGVREKGKGHSF